MTGFLKVTPARVTCVFMFPLIPPSLRHFIWEKQSVLPQVVLV